MKHCPEQLQLPEQNSPDPQTHSQVKLPHPHVQLPQLQLPQLDCAKMGGIRFAFMESKKRLPIKKLTFIFLDLI